MDISGWEKNQSFPYGGYEPRNDDQPGPLETIQNLNQKAGETLLNIGGQVLDTYDRVEQEVIPARRPAIQAASSWVDNNLTSLLKRWEVTEPYAQVTGDVAGAVTDLGLEIFTPGLEETVAGAVTLGAIASPFDGPFGDVIGAATTAGLYSKGVQTRAIKSIPDFKRLVENVFNGSWKIVDNKRIFVTPEGPIDDSYLRHLDNDPNIMKSTTKGGNYVQGKLPGLEYAYNYPVRKRFPWEDNPRKVTPPNIGDQVNFVPDSLLGHNVARVGKKTDINLANFNWSHPDSYRQFELAMKDIIQADDIAANQITRLGYRSSDDITRITKQKGVSQIYYDYLNGYFNRWIATGIEADFSKASKLIMPNGKTIQGSQQLARDLRRFYMNPEVFGYKGFKAGSKEYKQGIAKVIEGWQLGNKGLPTKWAAHHLNVIDEAWPLFIGLKPDEAAKLRKRLEKAGIFSGDDPKNLKHLPKEIHDKVHGIFWKKHRPPWAGKGGSDHSYRELMTNQPGFNTAKAREARINEYISAYKKVDQDLNLYINQFLLNNKGIDMNDTDAIVEFFDSIEPPPGF
tara:strand:+ start:75 stop:1778 length:1704 start_codon:yes stop_codon:yes gene_type:complete